MPTAQDHGISDTGDHAAWTDEEGCGEQAGTVESSPDYMSIKGRHVILETLHYLLTTLVNM